MSGGADLLKAVERRAERTIYFNVSYFALGAVTALSGAWGVVVLVIAPILTLGIWASWRDDKELKVLRKAVGDEDA